MTNFIQESSIYLILTCVAALLLSSCGTARIRKLELSAREEVPEMFIQKRDNVIVPIPDLKRHDYDLDSLVAIQTKRNYIRVDQGEEYVRLMKGQMNLYYEYDSYLSTTYSGPSATNPSGFNTRSRTRVTRYFDMGASQPLILLNRENLGQHLGDCPGCLDVLNRYDRKRKSLKWWKYGNWASIAGGLTLGFTGDDNVTDDSALRIYGFAGLLFGGLFSEFYRIVRVYKNEIRLEDAVTAYNQFKY